MFLVAFCLAGLIPTPGAWSDLRSQWLDAATAAVICIVFLIITARTFWKGGPLTGLQASLLCLIFGTILVLMVRELFTSMLFLQQVRNLHR
jgi:thiamine transporter ThiT